MNNMFHAFSIKLSGQHLDDKVIFAYDDYRANLDSNAITPEIAKTKAVAYVRMYKLKQALSTLQVPVYFEVKNGTEGTSLLVPTDQELVIGFGSLENLTGLGIIDEDTKTAAKTQAITMLKELVKSTLNKDYTMYAWTVTTTVRDQHPGVDSEITYTELKEEYVTAPAVDATPEVVYVEIKG